ncbi:uncharacterized protein NMK_1758 [Novimethylophilus kurashikiensis]|uniref:DUF2782 domain-containing protein n=1 Tax=Novimethylophilus kurashikiensis TaxID=1825523 RepID=A0A2R5FC28_9PROT|nr:DUF2782 domain-containing protein [Novimethylophilus kurashikiensis]GBG14194.1 uncharacterized protein NMK_1758 [Novimethylophilus kurashikiensis]
MRYLTRFRSMLAVLALATPLMAAAADAKPPALEPVPEPPPPPAGFEPDANTEPQVTIIKRGEDTIEEYRINGQLYMQKVTPSHGVPYYLVKESVDGGWARMDGPGERVSVPQWVLFRF